MIVLSKNSLWPYLDFFNPSHQVTPVEDTTAFIQINVGKHEVIIVIVGFLYT